jgi:CRISPR/Cas system CSM-associated protein Csm3 (group 7 of RAMP superfamily)
MKTLVLQGVITANSPISHNGGEVNGNTAMVRRMTVMQPDGTSVEVPYVSGNSFRGKLRNVSAANTLNMLGEDGEPKKVKADIFQMLFSGGTLSSKDKKDVGNNVGFFKELKTLVHVGLFGTAYGNAIIPGQMKIGHLIPICKETEHIIPKEFHLENSPSCYEIVQLEMLTRKEDSKDGDKQKFLERINNLLGEEEEVNTSQMIYNIETIVAGTQFYWNAVLEDVTDVEFDYFLDLLSRYKENPIVGGKSSIGYGSIDLSKLKWRELSLKDDSLTVVDADTKGIYLKYMSENKSKLSSFLDSLN